MSQPPPNDPDDDEAPKVPIGDAAAGEDDAPSGLPPGQHEETGENPGSQQDG